MTVATAENRRAVSRWKLGHHAFHLHLAAMNTELAEAVSAVERRDWPAVIRHMDRLAHLYDAATSLMRFTADFPASEYVELIRPSMAPPLVSPGFSGTLNIEHTHMLAQLTALRRAVRGLVREHLVPADVQAAAGALWRSQARNRRSHILVCERFVPDTVSLLQEFLGTNESREETP